MSLINPDSQYNTIENALKEGHRLAWKEDVGFIDITSKQAGGYKKLGWTTDLPELKKKVTHFIDKNGLNETQKSKLEQAFANRATSLKGRFVLFRKSKKDSAVNELNLIKNAISKKQITEIGQSSIPTNVPPSSSGPQIMPTETKKETLIRESQPQTKKTEKPKEKFSFSPFSDFSSEIEENSPPPPPPTGFEGAPPPPPPPGFGETIKKPKGPSFSHAFITKDRPKKALGEQTLILPKDVDYGDNKSVKGMEQKIKQETKIKIENFLEGTPIQTKMGNKRSQDGLVHQMKAISTLKNDYNQVLVKRAGKVSELNNKTEQLSDLEEDLIEMEQLENEGKSYSLFQVSYDKKTEIMQEKDEIVYPSSSVVKQWFSDFSNKSLPDIQNLLFDKDSKSPTGLQIQNALNSNTTIDERELKWQAFNELIPPQRTLTGLISSIKQEINLKSNEKLELEKEISNIDMEIKQRESQKNGDLEFKEFDAWLKDREELAKKLRTVVGWIGETKEEKPKSTKEKLSEEAKKVREELPFLQNEYNLNKRLGTASRTVNRDIHSLLNNPEFSSKRRMQKYNASLQKVEKK